jgi:hypothetical protein
MVCERFGCAVDKQGVPTVSLIVEFAPQRLVYLLQILTIMIGIGAVVALLVFRPRAARRPKGGETK